MVSFNRFEDIEALPKSRQFAKAINQATKNTGYARDYGLSDQIRRASVSVMSNIAEGFEREGNAEFRQTLYISKGSLGEVRSQLYVAFDNDYLSEIEFASLMALATEIARMLHGLIRYLNSSPDRGKKYRKPDNSCQ